MGLNQHSGNRIVGRNADNPVIRPVIYCMNQSRCQEETPTSALTFLGLICWTTCTSVPYTQAHVTREVEEESKAGSSKL